MTPEQPPAFDPLQFLNANLSGWSLANGVRYVSASVDEIVAEVVIDDRHRQPHGIVHGGVHCGLIETCCSAGAVLDSLRSGRTAVGLENNTSFLRAVREGILRVTAVPRVRGRRTQVWEGTVRDGTGRELAIGRVRLICLGPEESVSGQKLEPIGQHD